MANREITLNPDLAQSKVVRDSSKRQRIIAIALILVIAVFGLKFWKQGDWSFETAALVAFGSALFCYVGLAWALRFDFNKRGLITILPQPAIFVFGSILFLEVFFFQRFERISEALIFIIFLVIYALILVMVFLTSNILNVATVKQIPLVQAAQTSSYLISLFSVYVISFSVISSGLSMLYIFLLSGLIFFLVVLVHLSHFEISFSYVRWYALGISWSALGLMLAFMFWPLDPILIALVPTVVVYIGIGILMHGIRKILSPRIILEYVLVFLVVLILILSSAKWGIGGYFWM